MHCRLITLKKTTLLPAFVVDAVVLVKIIKVREREREGRYC